MLENFNELTPYVKHIVSTVADGIIGNRGDAWFTSLLYHQKKRFLNWINNWQPKENDIATLLKNDDLKILFSNMINNILNEISDEKLLIWPMVTDSLVRNKNLDINLKQLFISYFIKLDAFSIKYLAYLKFNDGIIYSDLVDINLGPLPLNHVNYTNYLGHLQCVNTGLIFFCSTSNKYKLSELGLQFIDFVSEYSK